MSAELWEPTVFMVAIPDGAKSLKGKRLNNLAYDLRDPGNSDLGEKEIWALTHLGTGRMVCFIEGAEDEIAPIATEFARAGRWDFTTPDGWKEIDPGLIDRVKILLTKHQGRAWRRDNRVH